MLEAPIVECVHCGAVLRATNPESQSIDCEHCHQSSPIGSEVRAAARAYRAAIKNELSALGLAEAVRRGWGRSTTDRVVNAFFGFVFVLSGAMSLALVATVIFDRSELVLWIVGAFVLCLVGSFGPFFLAVRWAMIREFDEDSAPAPPLPQPTSGALAARVASVCSVCGAPVYFGVDVASATCAHCRSTVLPSDFVRKHIEALTQFLTDLEKARHLRAHARSMGISRFFEGLDWVFGRFHLLTPIIVFWGVLYALTEIVRGELPEYEALLTVLPLAIALPFSVLIFGAAFAVDRFVRNRARHYSVMRELARRFRGQATDRGTRAAYDWLDAHWAGETPEGSMITQNSDQGKPVRRWVSWFHYRDHAVLVMLAKAPHVNRFDLFLSAHDRARPASAPRPVIDALAGAGLELSASSAGFHVSTPTSDPAWCQPETIQWILSTCSTR